MGSSPLSAFFFVLSELTADGTHAEEQYSDVASFLAYCDTLNDVLLVVIWDIVRTQLVFVQIVLKD